MTRRPRGSAPSDELACGACLSGESHAHHDARSVRGLRRVAQTSAHSPAVDHAGVPTPSPIRLERAAVRAYFLPSIHRVLVAMGFALALAAVLGMGVVAITANHRARAAEREVCRLKAEAIQARVGLVIERYVLDSNPCLALDMLKGEPR